MPCQDVGSAVQKAWCACYRSENWCNFPDQYCCVHLLDPLEPLFQDIGSAFIKVQHQKCKWAILSLSVVCQLS